MSNLVTNIQGYSIHDGPGIRTVVFLKGCGLECQWCSNPECISSQPEVGFIKVLCTKCGKCAGVCPEEALTCEAGQLPRIDRERCLGCGACSSVCDYKAIVLYGKSMSAGEVFDAVNRDKMFYDASGGGVTVSGGEPLLQPQFVCDLFEKCRRASIHTCLETSGYAGATRITRGPSGASAAAAMAGASLMGGQAGIMMWGMIASNFPEVPVIMEHGGMQGWWSELDYEYILRVAAGHPNVYLETGLWWAELYEKPLRDPNIGCEQLIWGTDWGASIPQQW